MQREKLRFSITTCRYNLLYMFKFFSPITICTHKLMFFKIYNYFLIQASNKKEKSHIPVSMESTFTSSNLEKVASSSLENTNSSNLEKAALSSSENNINTEPHRKSVECELEGQKKREAPA